MVSIRRFLKGIFPKIIKGPLFVFGHVAADAAQPCLCLVIGKKMAIHISLVSLGPIYEQLNMGIIKERLNSSQDVYVFDIIDPLLNLPAPTMIKSGSRNVSPQYDPDILFEYLYSHRGTNIRDDYILVGITGT